MPYGLRDSDLSHIIDAITQCDEISEVVLFGSRAKGNYQPGSDIDLAIKGDRITHATVNRLSECLNEEKPLPYFFDVVHYETLNNIPLREHIDRVGIMIFDTSEEVTGASSSAVSIVDYSHSL
jgi:uncharacterized protein